MLHISNSGIRGYLGEFCPALGSEFTFVTVQKYVENGALALVDIDLGVVLLEYGLVQDGRQHLFRTLDGLRL